MGNVDLKKEVTLKHKDGKNGASQPKKSKSWLWLLLLAVVVVAVILCVKYCSSNGNKEIVPEPTTMPIQETQSVGTEDITVSEEPASTPVSEPATQPAVNNKLTLTLPQETIEEKAKQVIRGNFGNGAARKQALGGEYDTIQRRVNEMYGLSPKNEY